MLGPVPVEAVSLRIVSVEAINRSNPQRPIPRSVQCSHLPTFEPSRRGGFVCITADHGSLGVDSDEPVRERPDPVSTLTILQDGGDVAERIRIRYGFQAMRAGSIRRRG